MSLGDAFPKEIVGDYVRRQLLPGTVIKLRQVMDDTKVHEKRFIVLHVSNDTFTCVINSELTGLQQRSDDLRRCQVSMPQVSHPFMRWDSYVDCSRIRRYHTQDVCDQIAADTTSILGTVSPALREEITSALKFSRTNAPADVRVCVDSLATVSSRT